MQADALVPLDNAALKAEFRTVFGEARGAARVHVIRAPGRVNLIGEHTDYNDGFVCPMAIEPEVRVVCRARPDDTVRVASASFPGQVVEFSITRKIDRGQPAWANYPRGVAAELLAAGIHLVGMDALIANNLPIGGGLSSSAALEVATALAFLTLDGVKMDAERLALICQKAEHEYALMPCGIMDQMIVTSAKAGHATLYDVRNATRQYVPLDGNELRVVIVNSGVRHELTGSEYPERRRQCEQGVEFFKQDHPQTTHLRDVTMRQITAAAGRLDDLILRRCRHVVSENARAVEFAGLLGQRKYEQAGQLMLQSHASLDQDFQVSTDELNQLVHLAMQTKGVYGARMTGGGFGGCIVALVQPRSVEPLRQHILKNYPHTGAADFAFFVTTPTAGAGVLE